MTDEELGRIVGLLPPREAMLLRAYLDAQRNELARLETLSETRAKLLDALLPVVETPVLKSVEGGVVVPLFPKEV